MLHQNCYHQKIFAQINLKVHYPLPYKRLFWDYKKANIDAINLAIKFFNWENALNGKDINSQMELFNKAFMKIFSNFIPNKTKSFRDSDPPWVNDDIKNKIKLKHKDFVELEYFHNEIDNLISKYYQNIKRKLKDPLTSSKTYWSIMKTFLSGKKVPVISPLLFKIVLVTDFQEKANIFNSFFAKQYTLISNNSVLPSKFTYMMEKRIQSIIFSESNVTKILRALDVNKAHGHDNISVRIIALCTNSLIHLL